MFEGFTLVQLLNHCEVFNVAVADDNFFLSLQNLYREYKWGGKCNLNFFFAAYNTPCVKTCRHLDQEE